MILDALHWDPETGVAPTHRGRRRAIDQTTSVGFLYATVAHAGKAEHAHQYRRGSASTAVSHLHEMATIIRFASALISRSHPEMVHMGVHLFERPLTR